MKDMWWHPSVQWWWWWERGESRGAGQTWASSWRRRTEERSRLSEEQTQMDFMSQFLSEGN